MSNLCDIGLMGLAVMGQNLVLNLADKNYRVAIFNRTTSKIDDFLAQEESQARREKIVPTYSLTEWVKSIARPRRVMLMIQSRDPVPAAELALYPQLSAIDAILEELLPLLDAGDIIIDGGNTHFLDTERRTRIVESRGFFYVGCGVSGGEEGARNGPSLMPGGSLPAWERVKEILQAIAAHVAMDISTDAKNSQEKNNQEIICCDWVGARGAGHYVKMIHNGIEYGDMQLIGEAYGLLRDVANFSAEDLRKTFTAWNRGELNSYLMEITADIFSVTDSVTGKPLVDMILDSAGSKGTGKWMSQLALDLGVPSTLVTEAVYARTISAMKATRGRAAKIFALPKIINAPKTAPLKNVKTFVDQVQHALYAAKICSYAQGFVQLAAAARAYDWQLDLGKIAQLWRGGCIIRAAFLDRISEAFAAERELENLLFAPYFQEVIARTQNSLREVSKTAITHGIPIPAMTSALAYYDSLRTANLPANLLQAQRDYFGAHTYQRTDQEGIFHTDWIGEVAKQRIEGRR